VVYLGRRNAERILARAASATPRVRRSLTGACTHTAHTCCLRTCAAHRAAPPVSGHSQRCLASAAAAWREEEEAMVEQAGRLPTGRMMASLMPWAL